MAHFSPRTNYFFVIGTINRDIVEQLEVFPQKVLEEEGKEIFHQKTQFQAAPKVGGGREVVAVLTYY